MEPSSSAPRRRPLSRGTRGPVWPSAPLSACVITDQAARPRIKRASRPPGPSRDDCFIRADAFRGWRHLKRATHVYEATGAPPNSAISAAQTVAQFGGTQAHVSPASAHTISDRSRCGAPHIGARALRGGRRSADGRLEAERRLKLIKVERQDADRCYAPSDPAACWPVRAASHTPLLATADRRDNHRAASRLDGPWPPASPLSRPRRVCRRRLRTAHVRTY